VETVREYSRPLMVLLVEPDPDDAQPVAERLRARACAVLVVPDAWGALEAAGGLTPDAVILGTGFPDAQARGVVRELGRLGSARPTPVVALATARGEGRHGRAQAGTDARPVTPAQLEELLDHLAAKVREAAAKRARKCPPE
jgi:DNA-binding response OmpR family regulator